MCGKYFAGAYVHYFTSFRCQNQKNVIPLTKKQIIEILEISDDFQNQNQNTKAIQASN